MRLTSFHITYVFLVIVYALLAYLKHYTSIEGFVRNYLSDLLALPLILSTVLFIVRKVKKLPFFYLSLPMMVFAFVYTSILFEFYLPYKSTKYTKDYYDILCYSIGLLAYFALQRQLKKEEFHKTI